MKLLTFRSATGLRVGLKTTKGVIDITTLDVASRIRNRSIAELINTEDSVSLSAELTGADRITDGLLSEDILELGPCIPDPGKIMCLGLNYRSHAMETGSPIPSSPILFAKYANTVAASGETIVINEELSQVDYEIELGVVIGRTASRVPERDALDYVWGYCIANDLSERDLQQRTSQWTLGKTLDQFMPIGPYLVTRDEVPDPQKLRLRTWMNGELRQDSTTADMIFSVAEIVSYLSRYFVLGPGDLILTGTPQGVILGMKGEKRWLSPGDELVLEIDNLGRQVSRFASPVTSR